MKTFGAATKLGFADSVIRSAFGTPTHMEWTWDQSSVPKECPNGKGCLTLSLCGAGTRVLSALDTRSDRLDLGFGAGYLRTVQARTSDSLEIRGALRELPTLSAQATFMNLVWIRPYVVGSFGLVDLWNVRAHTAAGKQSSVSASTFEYGMSLGVGVAPPFTNGRMLLEAGYRARNFASIGYSQTEPIGKTWPRQPDLSGWQLSAGWQFDLRTLTKVVGFGGSYTLTRVDGNPIPATLRHERTAAGTESTRQEIVGAYLDLDPRQQSYTLQLVTRRVTLSPNGIAQALRYDDPLQESGTWGYRNQDEPPPNAAHGDAGQWIRGGLGIARSARRRGNHCGTSGDGAQALLQKSEDDLKRAFQVGGGAAHSS